MSPTLMHKPRTAGRRIFRYLTKARKLLFEEGESRHLTGNTSGHLGFCFHSSFEKSLCKDPANRPRGELVLFSTPTHLSASTEWGCVSGLTGVAADLESIQPAAFLAQAPPSIFWGRFVRRQHLSCEALRLTQKCRSTRWRRGKKVMDEYKNKNLLSDVWNQSLSVLLQTDTKVSYF